MKFGPLCYREKTIDFLDKKGISWHATVVFYLPDDYGSDVENTSPHHLSMLFYDHIVQGDTQQDVSGVASLLEAAMMQLKIDLPKVKEVVAISDNATCYQNTRLPIILPFIAKAKGFSVLRFMHTETQDGKSMVDALFAIALQHVSKIVVEGMDVITSSTLVTALRAGGGLKKTAAELIQLERKNKNFALGIIFDVRTITECHGLEEIMSINTWGGAQIGKGLAFDVFVIPQ
ncbi:hypothetical protein BWQ96_01240 [Gracilariopsis chorda]|uniref:Uncharacterized protein n=1 Tax=Gracilariopsis chorda TaxID=448386 RepID=A0A2V3J3B4_9FLOR|nr:hypothetical protein BWQ96_01240 [Gracilariopsis chorda]|eukprot:PXF48898.1 hypothetical protein BWQ96_01240 [Gracilariopsis chorda]